ncbi:MAG: 50S ribosomal protein L10, partial [Ignavibacteria bacterium]
MCYDKKIGMLVVKNSLLKKALERSPGKDFQPLIDTALKGTTAMLFSESVSAPAKVIKEFRKKDEKPVLKGAFLETVAYVGDNQLDFLANIKSKNELIGELIGLLQSPARNIIGALLNKKDEGGDAPAAEATAA